LRAPSPSGTTRLEAFQDGRIDDYRITHGAFRT
jgi:hypothetical protein